MGSDIRFGEDRFLSEYLEQRFMFLIIEYGQRVKLGNIFFQIDGSI